MYAVINAGGKQERVEVGELVDVELLSSAPGEELSLVPLLVVDGDDVVTDEGALAANRVTATVVGEVKGPKIVGFTYKPKTRQRRHYGHRQRYTTIEITGIGARSPVRGEREDAGKASGTPEDPDEGESGTPKGPDED